MGTCTTREARQERQYREAASMLEMVAPDGEMFTLMRGWEHGDWRARISGGRILVHCDPAHVDECRERLAPGRWVLPVVVEGHKLLAPDIKLHDQDAQIPRIQEHSEYPEVQLYTLDKKIPRIL